MKKVVFLFLLFLSCMSDQPDNEKPLEKSRADLSTTDVADYARKGDFVDLSGHESVSSGDEKIYRSR